MMRFVDSGASYHISGNLSNFDQSSVKNIDPIPITLGNNEKVFATKQGAVYFLAPNGNMIVLSDVLYCSKIKSNLLSVLRIQEKGFDILFSKKIGCISKDNEEVFTVPRRRNNYIFNFRSVSNKEAIALQTNVEVDVKKWHARIGHINFQDLSQLSSKQLIKGLPNNLRHNELPKCHDWIEGKMSRSSFPPRLGRFTTNILQRVHSDVSGLITPASFG